MAGGRNSIGWGSSGHQGRDHSRCIGWWGRLPSLRDIQGWRGDVCHEWGDSRRWSCWIGG